MTPHPHGIGRRQTLKVLGGVLTGSLWGLSLLELACATVQKKGRPQATAYFSDADLGALERLTETLIPKTDTPGARDAGVASFIGRVLSEAHSEEQTAFARGLGALQERIRQRAEGSDLALAPSGVLEGVLTELCQMVAQCQRGVEVQPFMSAQFIVAPILDLSGLTEPDRACVEFFQAVKSLTITGYFHSEAGRMALGLTHGDHFHATYAGCTHPEHQEPPP